MSHILHTSYTHPTHILHTSYTHPTHTMSLITSRMIWFSQRVIDERCYSRTVASLYTKAITILPLCKMTTKPVNNPYYFKKGTIRGGYIIKMVKVPCRAGKRKAWRRL